MLLQCTPLPCITMMVVCCGTMDNGLRMENSRPDFEFQSDLLYPLMQKKGKGVNPSLLLSAMI